MPCADLSGLAFCRIVCVGHQNPSFTMVHYRYGVYTEQVYSISISSQVTTQEPKKKSAVRRIVGVHFL